MYKEADTAGKGSFGPSQKHLMLSFLSSFFQVTNLPHPYKTDCGMPKLRFFDTYSKSKCFLDTLTRYVTKLCKCRDWFMPGGDQGIPVCDFKTSDSCMWPAWEHFQEKKLDKCPVACESVEFSAQLSYARYPGNTYADKLLSKQRNMTGTIQENRQYLRYSKMLFFGKIVWSSFRSFHAR